MFLREFKRFRYILALLLPALLAWSACTSEAILDGPVECETTANCYEKENGVFVPGTVCSARKVCECELWDEGYRSCCFKYAPTGECMRNCYHPDLCADSPGTGGGGGDAGGGGDGTGGSPPDIKPECTKATAEVDCLDKIPEGTDKRCVALGCKEDKCVITVNVSPLASQIAGDCQTRYCMPDGTIQAIEDPSDYYNDGQLCTYDYCDGIKWRNEALDDGFSLNDGGYCEKGKVVECIAGNANAYNCGPGMLCDFGFCVSDQCMPSDCGGPCYPCVNPQACGGDDDCLHHVCEAGMCAIPSTSDGVKNNGETGVDCGGDMANPRCPTGGGCMAPEDCASVVCWAGKCQAPSCLDGRHNGDEQGEDCGGKCEPCP